MARKTPIVESCVVLFCFLVFVTGFVYLAEYRSITPKLPTVSTLPPPQMLNKSVTLEFGKFTPQHRDFIINEGGLNIVRVVQSSPENLILTVMLEVNNRSGTYFYGSSPIKVGIGLNIETDTLYSVPRVHPPLP